jgi:hypothetical protein
MFMRVHVAFNDVIGSHHSHFSSQPTGTWYTSMCPRPFLVKSNGQIFLRSTAQILSAFRGFGCRKFVHPHILNFHLPKSRNHCLLTYLILRSSSSPHDLRCRLFLGFWGFGFFGGAHLFSPPISQNVDFFLGN